jgi:hypothetical protein
MGNGGRHLKSSGDLDLSDPGPSSSFRAPQSFQGIARLARALQYLAPGTNKSKPIREVFLCIMLGK